MLLSKSRWGHLRDADCHQNESMETVLLHFRDDPSEHSSLLIAQVGRVVGSLFGRLLSPRRVSWPGPGDPCDSEEGAPPRRHYREDELDSRFTDHRDGLEHVGAPNRS